MPKEYDKIYKEDGGWSDQWMDFVKDMHVAKRSAVVDRVVNSDYASIADIGCGAGDLLHLIRQAGFEGRLIGTDRHLSEQLIRYSEPDRIELIEADFIGLELECDAAIFFSALHYADLEEVKKIIGKISARHFHIIEAFREYEENGILEEKLVQKTDGSRHLFSRAGLADAFLSQGFRLREEFDYSKDQDQMGRTFTYMWMERS